ncbi:MAG: hypothetical protein ACR2OC_04860 [Solirubrobacterales bacterium]
MIVLISIGLAFSAAAAVAAMTTLRGTTRDNDSKAALAAADAGAQVALYRQNQVLTTNLLPCVAEDVAVGGQNPPLVSAPLNINSNQGFCNPVSGTVGDASYEYEVSPPSLTDPLLGHKRRVSIVSTGTANGITRRVKVTATAPTGEAIFGDAGAIGIDELTLGGSSGVSLDTGATIGGAGSNGDVVLSASGLLCGAAQFGYGHGVVDNGGEQCPGFTNGEGQINLGTPVLPSTNDNPRITNVNQVGGDTSSPSNAFTSGKIIFDASIGSLRLQSNATLTLGGTNYIFCDLTLIGNSTLVIAGPASTRIYIRDPNDPACDRDPVAAGVQGPPQPQVYISGNSSIVTTSDDPTRAAILMLGAADGTATSALLTGNSKQNEFALYAPNTDITTTGNSTYLGMMAGKSLNLGGSTSIQIPSTALNFDASILTTFVRERFVECSTTVPAGGAPDANC